VYGGGALTPEGRIYAALLAIGDDAVASHIAAAVLHGFWSYGLPAAVDVTVPRHVPSRKGIKVHSVGELPTSATTVVRGIRVTTAARAAVDLAATVRYDKVYRRAVHEAQVKKVLSFGAFKAEVDLAPSNIKGRARLLAELTGGPTPTRSGFEDWGAELLRRHKFPRFLINGHAPGTPRWMEVDILFVEQRLVIELNGDRYHETPWRQQQDAYKAKICTDAGYRVLVLTDEDGKPEHEERTVAKIWALLQPPATRCR
jgi:very-short-patch-repair endonuclease